MKVIRQLCEKAESKGLEFNIDAQCVWIKYPTGWNSKQRYEFGELNSMAVIAALVNKEFEIETLNTGNREVYMPSVSGGDMGMSEGDAFRAMNRELRLLTERELFTEAMCAVVLGRKPSLNESPRDVAYADILTAYPNGTIYRKYLPKNFFYYAALTNKTGMCLLDEKEGYKAATIDPETYSDYLALMRGCFDEIQMTVLRRDYRESMRLPENVA